VQRRVRLADACGHPQIDLMARTNLRRLAATDFELLVGSRLRTGTNIDRHRSIVPPPSARTPKGQTVSVA
jgi:hypothetical protein